MMAPRADPNKNVNGSVTQTLDVLDFSMLHLSWYERLQRRHARNLQNKLKIDRKDKVRMDTLSDISAVEATVKVLKVRALQLRNPNLALTVPELNRTIAIMPFLGSDMGAGHSNLNNRYEIQLNGNPMPQLSSSDFSNNVPKRLVYLHACFWSVYAEIPHVVIAVKNSNDAHYAMYVPHQYPLDTLT